MRLRFAYFALCALVLAGLVHIAIILLIPQVGTRDAFAVISRNSEPLQFRQIDGTGQDALLSDIDPFFAYGVCRFDLANAGMIMRGPKTATFWTATILDEDGAVIYSMNERTSIENRLELIVLNAVQTLQLREAQPPEAETAIVVEADVRAGFVVFRLLRPDDTFAAQASDYLKEVRCDAYLPGQSAIAPADGQEEEAPAADGEAPGN
jgi:uncharacterized membrane protein